jgi:hypothetical protein
MAGECKSLTAGVAPSPLAQRLAGGTCLVNTRRMVVFHTHSYIQNTYFTHTKTSFCLFGVFPPVDPVQDANSKGAETLLVMIPSGCGPN